MTNDVPAGAWISEFDTPTSDETEWTAANVQEALPGLITPMSWSLISPLLNYGFARPAQRLGSYVAPRDPYVALFYSRAYLNATALREGAKRIPGGSPDAIDEQYLGRQRDPNAPEWTPSFRDLLAYVPILPRMVLLLLRARDEIGAIERQVQELREADTTVELSRMSASEVVDDLERGLDVGREVAALHIGVSGGASASFEILRRLMRSWLGDEDGSLQSVLVSGLTGVESAKPSKALWDLSRLARESPEVLTALDATYTDQVLDELRASEAIATRRFVGAYDAFIESFGHRSVMEGELSAPLWEEDAATVLAMIRKMSKAGAAVDPYLIEARQRRLRESETARTLASLSPLKRLAFSRVLSVAQGYIVNRERTKSLLVKGTQRARRLVKELGRRLTRAGTIQNENDIFYITLEEAARAARGEVGAGLKGAVVRRRREMERNRHVVLPELFRGRPCPIAIEKAGEGDIGVLRGIPVSPGKVSGLARVIMDPRLDGAIEPGEVLVAPVTDAGWTPLFLLAAALVVDIGGPLSHGATVAREMGLPAVVNVKQATKVIKTGQRVTVDGREGTVTIEG